MANEFKVKKGLIVQGSGSSGDNTILDVQGNQGQLFSITDSLEGTLFSVSDISGIPILDVNSNEIVKIGTFGSEGIIVNGSNVTASAHISASGTITANAFVGDGSGITGISGFVDTSGTVNANEFARFSDSNTLTALTAAETRAALNVDDGANNYVLPTNLAGDDIDIDTGALTGAVVVSDIDINITTNTSGLVTDANGAVSTRTLTLANLGYTGATDATNNTGTVDTTGTINNDEFPQFSDSNTLKALTVGEMKTALSLNNVANESRATILGGNLTGTINSVAVATVTAGAALGATSNQDSTSTIRSGTTKSDVDLGNVTNESKATMFSSAALTGNPTAPTQAANNNSTRIATTAYVQTELTDLIGTAPAALDTLGELSASLASDQTGLASLTTTVSGKLAKSSNLSDLTNASTARTNLGVDPAGTDNSTNVSLTGTPDYITISGQTITRNAIDLTADVTGVLPIGNGGTGQSDLASVNISEFNNNSGFTTNTGTVTGTGTSNRIALWSGTSAIDSDSDFYVDGDTIFTTNLEASNIVAASEFRLDTLGDAITFYGGGQLQHSIMARDASGTAADDLRINSYGAVYVNLDSNNNNTSTADFVIGNHGDATGTINTLFTLSGEDGDATFSGTVIANGTTLTGATDISGKQDTIDASNRLSATLIGANGNISNTEYGYLNGVTSAIQTQLDAKQGSLTFGIGNGNVGKFNANVADNDFLRIDGTSIEGRSASEMISDLGIEAGATANTGTVTNVTVGTGLDVSNGSSTPSITLDLSEFTDMTADVVGSQDELILLDNGAERKKMINEIKLSQFNNDSGFVAGDTFDNDGTFASLRAQGTTKGDVGLGNVENTAISTFAGSSNITTVGTIGTGTWQGTAIASAYLDSDTAHLSGTQTFSGAKTFSSPITVSDGSYNGLTIVGSGQSHTQGAIIIKSSTSDTPEARGQGVFLFNEGDDVTWYMGTRYQDADEWQVGRKTGTSLDTSAATTAQSYLKINSSGNATFAGTIGSGAITSTGKIQGTELEGTSLDINGDGAIDGKVIISDDDAGALTVRRSSNTDQALYLRGGAGSGEGRVAAQYSLDLVSGLGGSNNYDLKLITNAGTALQIDASDSNKAIFSGTVTANGVTLTGATDISGKQDTITGAATTIDDANLTANRAVISNGSGKIAVSDVTSTELGYLDGVTSAVQTQLNAKAASGDTITAQQAQDISDNNNKVSNATHTGDVTGATALTIKTNVALAGNPTTTTQTAGNDSTRIATTAFVGTAIDNLIGTAGSTLDTLGELSASLADTTSSLNSLVTTVGTKLAKSSNLSDLSNAGTARTNLGLGTAAQSATGDFATAAQGTKADAALPKSGGTMTGAIAMGNFNITGVNVLTFNDPGPNEGLSWSGGNMKLYESPNDLTTNTAGNLQFVYGSTRRLTVDNSGIDVNGTITVSGTVDGRDVAADGTKLDGIEDGATADQSNAEIRAAVEAATDSNVFTDNDHSKLNGIEAAATADQSAAEIRNLLGTGNGNLVPSAGSSGQFLKHDGTFGTPSYTTNTDNQLSQEQVEDYVGGMLGGTETGITVTYQDATGDIDFVVASQTDNNFTTTLKNKLDGFNQGLAIDDDVQFGETTITGDLISEGSISLGNNSKIVATNTSTTYIKLNNDDGFIINANNVEAARMFSNGVVINEGGAATMDFRVESDSNNYALFVDSGNNQVVIGGATGYGGALLSVNGDVSSSGDITAVTGSFDALVGDTSQATSLVVDGPITASGGIISDNIETFWTSFNCDGDASFATSAYGPNTQGINYYHWNKNWTSTTSDGGDPEGDHVHRTEINTGWYVPYKIKVVGFCGGLHDGSAASTTTCTVKLFNTAASLASSNYDSNTGTTKELVASSGNVTLNGNRWKHYDVSNLNVTLEEGQYIMPRITMGENLTNLRGQFTIKYKRVV